MDHYTPSGCKEVKIAEKELFSEIAELKIAISETLKKDEKVSHSNR